MHSRTTRRMPLVRIASLATLLLTGTLLGGARSAKAQSGAVFSSTNSAVANSVVMFKRGGNGSLTPYAQFLTGGVGTGSGLGSAGAVILSPNNQWLFTVNAGSNDISVFAVRPNQLTLVDRVPSGGTNPVSLTLFGNWLYVVNGGTPANITGFTVSRKGHLTPISGATQSLSTSTVKPGQIKFSPYGDLLVVTEQTTNLIDVFPVAANGVAAAAITAPSLGTQPFGFDFDPAGHLLISEAATSSASSYFVSTYGVLPISGAIANGQKAACWLISGAGGRFAWTTNAASDNLSGYIVKPNGTLSLIPQQSGIAVSLPAGSHPTDETVDGSGHLYVLDAFLGAVTGLRIRHDGTLTPINTSGAFGTSMAGIAAM